MFVDPCIIVNSNWNSQQDVTVYQNLLFHVYMKLNMFRATHHPSLGAQNCNSSLWFCIRERLWTLRLLDAVALRRRKSSPVNITITYEYSCTPVPFIKAHWQHWGFRSLSLSYRTTEIYIINIFLIVALYCWL